jgi:hypothetical protein
LDGQVIGGALWRTRQAVGTTIANNLAFKALQVVPRARNFEDYQYNIYLVDNSEYNGSNLSNIEASFAHHDIISVFPPPPPPSVSISGPSNMFQGTSDTFTANVSGGTPPYNYQWYYRHESNWNWTATGTNSSTYTHTAGSPNGEYVRVVVTDAYPNINEDTHYFTIIGWSFAQQDSENIESQPQAFALTQNYPNPFNPTTTISYDLPEQADVLLQVFDLMGRKITTLEAANRSAGSYTATFDASQLSSGLYIARMRATGFSGEIFTRELKMQLVK